MPRFTRSKVPPEVQDFHERVAAAMASLERDPLYGASLLEDVTLTAPGTNLVSHKRGKPVRLWKIVRIDTPTYVHEDTASTADRTRFLPLITTLTAKVSLLVKD